MCGGSRLQGPDPVASFEGSLDDTQRAPPGPPAPYVYACGSRSASSYYACSSSHFDDAASETSSDVSIAALTGFDDEPQAGPPGVTCSNSRVCSLDIYLDRGVQQDEPSSGGQAASESLELTARPPTPGGASASLGFTFPTATAAGGPARIARAPAWWPGPADREAAGAGVQVAGPRRRLRGPAAPLPPPSAAAASAPVAQTSDGEWVAIDPAALSSERARGSG